MNGIAKRAVEWSVVATVASALSIGATLLTQREVQVADSQSVKDRVTAVESLAIETASSLKTHLEKCEQGYHALYSLESDVRSLRERQEWIVSSVAAIARKQGVPFSAPPPEAPRNRGPEDRR